MKPLLQKLPDYIILHIGLNYALDNTSRETFDKILKLKTYIQKELPKCKITIATPIKQHGHEKASLTISYLSKKFKDLSISVVNKSNIGQRTKNKFSSKDLFSKCDQIRSVQRIWSRLLKKSLMENFIFVCSGSFLFR